MLSVAQDQLYKLALIRLEGVGPVTYFKLLELYKDAEQAFYKYCEEKSISPESQLEKAKIEYTKTIDYGAGFLFYGQDNYPQNLNKVKSAPPVLIYKGDVNAFTKPAIAMVGTRNASAAGIINAQNIASGLGELGYVVVSGLARGIDFHCHKSSLKAGTVAVIAGGIDNIYPPEHKDLQQQITTTENCCLVTEKPIGYKPKARDFHGRNRIISALSNGVVVVEAAIKSGSIITASFAEKQGRPVLAVPGSPIDKRYSGTNYLIKNGAALVETGEDVPSSLQNSRLKLKEEIADFMPQEDVPNKNSKELLHSLLGYSPVQVEKLTEISGLSAAEVLSKVTELELEGKVKKERGGALVLVA